MNVSKMLTALVAVLACAASAPRASADVFGSGANTFNIDFVPIGNAGNPADSYNLPNPVGSVNYDYRMAKFEVSEQMIDNANALGGLGITKDPRGPNMPASNVGWNEAARFVNWLNTSTNHLPAYKFTAGVFSLWQPGDPGYNPAYPYRNSRAQYFLPNLDEWHKAAFYNPASGGYFHYATGSNTAPTPVAGGTAANTAVYIAAGPASIFSAGGLSPYGTMAQSGNMWEWQETELGGVLAGTRVVRGGGWLLMSAGGGTGVSSTESTLFGSGGSAINLGFRVASHIVVVGVPEPSAAWIGALGGLGLLASRRRAVA